MESHLRPMSLGEILDRTAQLYRENFFLFAGIASVYAGALLAVGLAQTVLQEWLRVAHMVRVIEWTSGVSILVTWTLMFIFGGIAVAANNRAVAWLHLGEAATIRGAYRSILPRVWRYLWLGFIKLILAWSPIIAVYGCFIGMFLYIRVKGFLPQPGAAPPPPAAAQAMLIFGISIGVLGLLSVPAFVYGVMMGLRYALAVPACVVEDLKARAAIRRSIALSKWSRGRIFVLWLLVACIELGLGLVTQSFFIVATLRNHQQLPLGLRILQQIVGFCTTTFVHPILSTGLTLFYFDQRVRKEGYDIEWMMQAAGLTAPAPAPATPEPPLSATEAQHPWHQPEDGSLAQTNDSPASSESAPAPTQELGEQR
jgi:hypothetical protein